MSITLALTGNTSVLSLDYFPPIELNDEYECGLVDLQTYHSIPNVDLTNNLFHIGDLVIEIPIGSYEIDDIAQFLKKEIIRVRHIQQLYHRKDEKNYKHIENDIWEVNIYANNNTLNSVLISTKKVYFDQERSIGSLLGFSSNRELNANILHTSDLPVNINKVNTIRIECNIISGSYSNAKQSHILHEFSPVTEPGYKIVEVPKNVIYLPLNVKVLSILIVKLVDQDGDLINFRGEKINLRLHIRKRHHVGV